MQHSDPVCKTWVAHKGDRTGKKMQDFLGLALMAKGAAAIDLTDLQVPDRDSSSGQRAFTEREKEDAIEELHEGLKNL